MSWERAAGPPANPSAARGDFASAFDFALVEIEQFPRGRMRLEGRREGRPVVFDLPTRAWRVAVRPAFEGSTLAGYLEGARLLEAGRAENASAQWRRTAAAASRDLRREDAAWLYARIGEVELRSGTAGSALKTYDAALQLADRPEDWAIRARIRDAFGTRLLERDRLAQAAEQYRKARALVERQAPDSLALAFALERLGDAEADSDRPASANLLYGSALALREKRAPDSIAVASSLAALARVAADLDSARALFGRSLALWAALAPGSLEEARALSDLAALEFQSGDLLLAERLQRKAYAVRKKLDPGGLDLAASLYGLGNVAWRRGDLAAAEDFHRRALAIRQKIAPDGAAVEASLNALGNVAGARKDFDAAERFHRQALAIGQRRSPDGVEPILHNLGEDARLRGDYAGSEAFLRQALEMHDRLPPGSNREIAIANTLVSLAALARDRGDLAAAETLIRRALEIRESHEPDSLHLAEDREVLADVLRLRGRAPESRELYAQILRAASRLAPRSELEARALHGLGLLDRAEGRTGSAALQFRRAVDILESQQTRVGGTSEARQAFSSAYAEYWGDGVEALLALSNAKDAYAMLERSRARSLLAMLAERDLVLASDVPAALEAEQRRAGAAYEDVQARLRQLRPGEPAAERERLLDRLGALREQRARTIEEIKRTSGRYASLRYPQPLDLSATRASLDPGTLLLSYSVRREKAVLFVVEPAAAAGDGLSVFTLRSGGAALWEEVEAYRGLIGFRGPASAGAGARELTARARSLYDTLLAPAEPLMQRYERILIIPDGPLLTLPFAALLRPGKDGRPEHFVEWKPVHTAVSATVYAELRKGRAAAPRDPPVIVAAFGDPQYPKAQENAAAALRGAHEDDDEAELDEEELASSTILRGFRFSPLPESRTEVESIVALYAPRSVAYLGADATEEKARSVGRDVPLIHYACHAVVNERFPLDSALVFTIPEKPEEGRGNGLLQAWEIFETMRIDADLVTLSACESGLGREMGGEGLIGLTRAFQYAGARSVLASLWKVEDKATGKLMKRFYVNLKAGNSKDQALRLAQIDMIRSAHHSRPADWAAFELNGDWK